MQLDYHTSRADTGCRRVSFQFGPADYTSHLCYGFVAAVAIFASLSLIRFQRVSYTARRASQREPFLYLDQARQIIAAWDADYNTRRPHSSLGYKTPAAYADHLTATGHRAALPDGSARCPVAHTAPKGVSTAEALIAAG